MGSNDPLGGAIFHHRDVIGRTYVKLHITMLQIRYRSFGSWGSQRSLGFREEDFWFYSILLFTDGNTNFTWISNFDTHLC